MAEQDVLDLGAIAPPRTPVRFNGEQIGELAVREDFGLLEYQRMARLAEEMDTILANARPSQAQSKRVGAVVDELAGKLIIGADPGTVAKVPEMAKVDVISRFFAFVKAKQLAQIAAAAELLPGSSSPDSNGSTEATPNDG